ncbi:hypothetical protein CXB51_034945 [Gossypium anomalum]|uniref:Uncharacterized protein n=1 Tax=Gossypium anomalum TaxID=47600 RepID=A0A8J5XXA7_9ROSI|nr:hypothetical protein CXB51_034945 [Gossypium anomalum]
MQSLHRIKKKTKPPILALHHSPSANTSSHHTPSLSPHSRMSY